MNPINLHDYELIAREQLPAMVFDYYFGGAEDELTVRENRLGWQRLRFRPSVLVDVATRDLTTTVLGQRVALPILTAPCAFNALAHPEGELAVARAATRAGIIQVVSTAGTYTLEEVAAAAPNGGAGFSSIATAIAPSPPRSSSAPSPPATRRSA